MHRLNLSKQLFWIITSIIITTGLIISWYLYQQTQNLIQDRALTRSQTLQTYFVSMRYVYHQRFLESGLDLNDSTVGFLPAHASVAISDEFAKRSRDGITIRNVTDRPRNPSNEADEFEKASMIYFAKNPTIKEKLSIINQNGEEYFLFTTPLKIESYCIQCHGKKEEVIPFITKRYDKAYDYNVGDIRGVTSIKIPRKVIADKMISMFWKEMFLAWSAIIFLLALIYYVIRQITRKDIETKKMLEAEVHKRTKELEKTTQNLEDSNRYQQHLFSILRTVADSNQILITSQSLDELIDKTALCLIGNQAFLSVKISLFEEGELRVKVSYGIEQEKAVLPIEQIAFDRNTSIILTDFSSDISEECRRKVAQYGITSVYASALRKDTFATTPFGVIMICTTQPNGFTPEETAMIDELSGDLGFAINSFYQKENILKLSFYDPLTELPNRRLLMERLSQAMISSGRTQQYGGLLFIDLDNFKGVNDLQGHLMGDRVLKEMGERLLNVLRQSDTVARFGGDEFVILVENIGTDESNAAIAIQTTADKILETAKKPFILNNQSFYLSASIGIVLFIDNEMSVDQLFSYADSAMYAAKNSGRNTTRFYDSSLQEKINEQAKLLHDLRASIELNQLYVVYQEQVNIHGVTNGVEALMRWEHPSLGLISPAKFIPMAESSGMIIPLGDWILDEVIRQIRIWSDDPIKQQWRVSINISPKQFEEQHFITKLETKIRNGAIDPSKIRLELTEGLLIHDIKYAMEKIQLLKSMGFTLSIDDFGTGYSSLSYLKNLPIDELKIDQSFVKALPESASDQIIIQTIITIGKTFGLEVIAEGVETAEQFQLLKEMECQSFQGFLFSHPQKG